MKQNKKRSRRYFFLAGFGILGFCCLCAGFFCFFRTGDAKAGILKETGLDVSSCEVLRELDTHGGFHGDGETFWELRIPEGDVRELAGRLTEEWKELPLSENLAGAAGLLLDKKQKETMLSVQEGYYYFRDRYPESTDPADDSKLLERNSQNFTLVIFDKDGGRIYYAALDS